MARFPFRIGYCGKPARHTGVSHLLRLLVMQTCLWLSYHMAPTAVNISPASYLYRFTRSYYVFFALAEKPPPPSRESRWDPPAHLWSARTGSRPTALWRLINSNFVPNTVLAPTFLLPDSAAVSTVSAIPSFALLQKMTADGPKCMDQHPEMYHSAAPAPFFDIKTSGLLLTSRRDDVIMFFMK